MFDRAAATRLLRNPLPVLARLCLAGLLAATTSSAALAAEGLAAPDPAATGGLAVAPAVSPPGDAPSTPLVPYFAPDADLWAAFGGKEGVFRLADLFVDKMRTDKAIGHYFTLTKIARLKTQLGDQLCQVLAGPCVYDGDSMKASHADLKITKADSFRQVEILQSSMDELGIAFSDQNKLLARLAPMYREIITR